MAPAAAPVFVVANPRGSLATHLPRWRPRRAGYGRAAPALPAGGLSGGACFVVLAFSVFFEYEFVVMVLLVVWMLAATRRDAGVFGDFVGVLHLLLDDWACA